MLKKISHKKTDYYNFETVNNEGDEHGWGFNGYKNMITIEFINGKFEKADFNFGGKKYYNRQDWKILKAIEEKISEIEEKISEIETEKKPSICYHPF